VSVEDAVVELVVVLVAIVVEDVDDVEVLVQHPCSYNTILSFVGASLAARYKQKLVTVSVRFCLDTF
jgi:hypothetical protein